MIDATRLHTITLRQAHAFMRGGYRGGELYTMLRDWLCDSGRTECVGMITEWTGLKPPSAAPNPSPGPKFIFASLMAWAQRANGAAVELATRFEGKRDEQGQDRAAA